MIRTFCLAGIMLMLFCFAGCKSKTAPPLTKEQIEERLKTRLKLQEVKLFEHNANSFSGTGKVDETTFYRITVTRQGNKLSYDVQDDKGERKGGGSIIQQN